MKYLVIVNVEKDAGLTDEYIESIAQKAECFDGERIFVVRSGAEVCGRLYDLAYDDAGEFAPIESEGAGSSELMYILDSIAAENGADFVEFAGCNDGLAVFVNALTASSMLCGVPIIIDAGLSALDDSQLRICRELGILIKTSNNDSARGAERTVV